MTRLFAAPLVLWAMAAAGNPPAGYAQSLAGKRLVMKGASCAGLGFTAKGALEMYAELECSHGHEPTVRARVRWLTADIFLATETERVSKDCPPRNWIYKVEALTAKTARLREIWTGWPDAADSVLDYKVVPVGAAP